MDNKVQEVTDAQLLARQFPAAITELGRRADIIKGGVGSLQHSYLRLNYEKNKQQIPEKRQQVINNAKQMIIEALTTVATDINKLSNGLEKIIDTQLNTTESLALELQSIQNQISLLKETSCSHYLYNSKENRKHLLDSSLNLVATKKVVPKTLCDFPPYKRYSIEERLKLLDDVAVVDISEPVSATASSRKSVRYSTSQS